MSVIYTFSFYQKSIISSCFCCVLNFLFLLNFETDLLSVLRLANGNVPV